mmetsp:Transcript_12311/g.14564  ORF Transcript_12311/g.14564 Transcript_12311/m.14564 type:complete len:302 (+) Transcript_12311:136-1041(+)|eukprot:jgi/Bigna1/85787/estExt_fgenesh1_pg.C_60118
MSSGKKRSISYASSSQMALSKKGRAFGDLKVLHSFPNKNVAKGHTVKNPFSSLTIEVDTEACGSFRDLKDQIIDRIGFGKSILFLLDGHILEENADVKGADPKSVQFALRDDLAPTLTAIQNAKRGSLAFMPVRDFEAVVKHVVNSDKKLVRRRSGELAIAAKKEQLLRVKFKSVLRQVKGCSQVDPFDDLEQTDFSCHSFHVMAKCVRNLQARLKVAIREVSVRTRSLERSKTKLKESSDMLESFRKCFTASEMETIATTAQYLTKENQKRDGNLNERNDNSCSDKDPSFCAQSSMMLCD